MDTPEYRNYSAERPRYGPDASVSNFRPKKSNLVHAIVHLWQYLSTRR